MFSFESRHYMVVFQEDVEEDGMKRLALKNINTGEEYGRIFKERSKFPVDWNDVRRWKLLMKYYRGGSLADLGCLDSQIPILAREKCLNAGIWAIDQSEKVIEAMRWRKKGKDILYEVGDVYALRFPDAMFDYVVAGELIEHLEMPFVFLTEAFRILKKGGILALSTPLEETGAGEVDKERHLWSFEREDIQSMLSAYGKTKSKILRSQWFPKYRYAFPIIIAWCKKR